MRYWKILDISPTNDLREIKRAYAKKLKVTRPDEKPNEFQELHWAYKTALFNAHSINANANATLELDETFSQNEQATKCQQDQAHADIVLAPMAEPNTELQKPVEITTANTSDALAEEILELDFGNPPEIIVQSKQPNSPTNQVHTPEVSIEEASAEEISVEDEPEPIDPLQLEGEALATQVETLLNTNHELHQPEAWSFLMNSPHILDDRFNWKLGLGVLRLIREHNHKNANRPLILIGARVLCYLDSIFNWSTNRHYIFRYFDENEYAPLLDAIDEYTTFDKQQDALEGLRGGKSIKVVQAEKKPETLYYANSFKRFCAFAIDLILFFILAKIMAADLEEQTSGKPSSIIVAITPFLFFFYYWLCECSSGQATLGKLVMGLVVTDKTFERMSYGRGLWRTIVFFITLPFSYIVMILNGLLGDKFIHDRITKTYAIDMRRSRNQH